MSACRLQNRRTSYSVIREEEETVYNGFPKRKSLTTKLSAPQTSSEIMTSVGPQRMSQIRRHSEVTLPEIQTVNKREESKPMRKFSLIHIPKDVSERPNKGQGHGKPNGKDVPPRVDLSLPRIPSVTPEPEAIRLADRRRYSEAMVDEFKHGSYRPKHCWCFRCQLMYSMFKAGDDRLTVWGNYPCFRK